MSLKQRVLDPAALSRGCSEERIAGFVFRNTNRSVSLTATFRINDVIKNYTMPFRESVEKKLKSGNILAADYLSINKVEIKADVKASICLLYTSPSPRD